MNIKPDIFVKIDSNEIDSDEMNSDKKLNTEEIILNKLEVVNTIPKNCLKQKNLELAKTKIEWRWRIFKIPEHSTNELVEITKKTPNEERLYINKYGDWINYKMDDNFNKYVVNEYYVYE
jgi:hypothetical protein